MAAKNAHNNGKSRHYVKRISKVAKTERKAAIKANRRAARLAAKALDTYNVKTLFPFA